MLKDLRWKHACSFITKEEEAYSHIKTFERVAKLATFLSR